MEKKPIRPTKLGKLFGPVRQQNTEVGKREVRQQEGSPQGGEERGDWSVFSSVVGNRSEGEEGGCCLIGVEMAGL